MKRGLGQGRHANSWGWLRAGGGLSHLLLVLFALRAIIPVGYMPDPAALQDGRFEIVVCTPTGLKTVTVLPDRAGPDGTDDGAADGPTAPDCPFQTVIAKAMVLPDQLGVPLRWIPVSRPVAVAPASAAPEALLLGPPLGPRAPPARSL